MNRKILILLFAIFFGIISPLLLTESFIENFNNIRRSMLLTEKENTKTIEIDSKIWVLNNNIDEIFYENEYYDVQKTTQKGNKTTLTLVKDNFENVIKNSLGKKSSKKDKNKQQINLFPDSGHESDTHNFLTNSKQIAISTIVLLCNYNSSIFSFTKPPIF